ncbi:MAG: hypothetical protein ACK4EY_04410 [Flavipsychrobacter sp.]|nr:hypothetical protein [Chitinophagales bacterium]
MTKKLMMLSAVFAIAMASCSKTTPMMGSGGNGQEKIGNNNGSNSGNNNADTTKPPIDTSDRGGDTPIPEDCAGVYCTQQFEMVYFEVKNSSGATVTLTSFHTEDMAGNKLPTHLYEYDSYRDAYVVINDGWVRGNENTTKQVRFVGYVGSTKVVNEVYTIATDCCHIAKTAGKDKVVLP